jgi:hypothetical protein
VLEWWKPVDTGEDPDAIVTISVRYISGPLDRKRFLRGVGQICHDRDVECEWDLVGILGARRLEVTFHGRAEAVDAVQHEVRAFADRTAISV